MCHMRQLLTCTNARTATVPHRNCFTLYQRFPSYECLQDHQKSPEFQVRSLCRATCSHFAGKLEGSSRGTHFVCGVRAACVVGKYAQELMEHIRDDLQRPLGIYMVRNDEGGLSEPRYPYGPGGEGGRDDAIYSSPANTDGSLTNFGDDA